MASELLLILICGLIFALLLVSSRLNLVTRYILRAQCVYWFLGYVLRPVCLIWAQPLPQYGDNIADIRLLRLDGNYANGMSPILAVVTLGLVAFTCTVFICTLAVKGTPSNVQSKRREQAEYWIPVLLIVCFQVVGVLFEYVCHQGLTENIVAKALSTVARFSVAVYFLYCKIDLTKLWEFICFGIIAFLSVVDSVIIQSKNPIFGWMFFFVLWLGRSKLQSHRKRLIQIAIVPLALVLFQIIQALKMGSQGKSVSAQVAQTYPFPFDQLFSIITRFDLFRSVADSYFTGVGSWLTPFSYVKRVMGGPLPQFGQQSTTYGQDWATHIASATSVHGQEVSLAQGFIADGWSVAGAQGVVLSSVLFAGLTLFCGKMLSSKFSFISGIFLYPVVGNALFEQGLAGNSEVLSSGIKATLICLPVIWLINRPDSVVLRKHKRDSAAALDGKSSKINLSLYPTGH